MAKDRFYPSKPHVNVARQRLQQIGMTTAGVDQLLNGRPVLQLADCQLLTNIVLEAAAHADFVTRAATNDVGGGDRAD